MWPDNFDPTVQDMIRQCAWCLQVADSAGRYSLQPGAKLHDATHGICPPCAAHELATIKALAERQGRVLAPARDERLASTA